MLLVQARQLGLDQLEALGGHEVVGRDRPVGEVVVDISALSLLGEGLAHRLDYITPRLKIVPQLARL